MKLKTLMKNYDGLLIIFYGDYTNDPHIELVATIGCNESDRDYYFEDEFETIDESSVVAEKVSNCINLNINKMYINTGGKLVVYVK